MITFRTEISIMALIMVIIAGCTVIHEPENIVIPERIYPEINKNSLWPGENSQNMLFVDNKARYKNDIITILIEEESKAQGIATTETSNESDVTMGISSFLGIQRTNPNTLTSGAIASKNDKEFKGDGKTARSGKLKAIITARILDILPNGNFFVEGKREIKINNENQMMGISGIVRPLDIASDNTILSRYIADAKITYSGVGVLNDKQGPGWAVRILDWIWPF